MYTGCSDTLDQSRVAGPLTTPQISSISASPWSVNTAQISFARISADSVRAHYASADSSETGTTPWLDAQSGSMALLGLRAGITYNVTIEAKQGTNALTSSSLQYSTAQLPAALAGMSMSLMSGSPPASGYTLIALPGPDRHGYLVAFDRSGAIRWYRDFGAIDVQEAKQQANGDLTVYVGNATGGNPLPGAFVELTPSGDSVRTISAKGSSYTDGHELIVTSDMQGNRVADYLFGYNIRSVDQTAFGGGAADPVAGHQLLRISSKGTVDTLLQGWTYWTHADRIDPPVTDEEMDHPNSIAFDTDGGVIASFRNTGAILKIDPSTKKVLWQMGGLRNQFTFVNDPLNGFSGQHSVRVLPNGHFIVFDNGVSNTPQMSRAVEYAVDESAKTATMVWQYLPSPSLFNQFTGSIQRLVNGNTVVAWTNYGLVDEVESNGSLVNRMQINSSASVVNTSAYRAIRIDNLYSYKQP
jgi:hypothetical protein